MDAGDFAPSCAPHGPSDSTSNPSGGAIPASPLPANSATIPPPSFFHRLSPCLSPSAPPATCSHSVTAPPAASIRRYTVAWLAVPLPPTPIRWICCALCSYRLFRRPPWLYRIARARRVVRVLADVLPAGRRRPRFGLAQRNLSAAPSRHPTTPLGHHPDSPLCRTSPPTPSRWSRPSSTL